jgi:hypothetical protein
MKTKKERASDKRRSIGRWKKTQRGKRRQTDGAKRANRRKQKTESKKESKRNRANTIIIKGCWDKIGLDK